MASAVFDVAQMLDAARLHYFLERTRPDTIRFSIALVGERVEIDVFDDNHIEIARFRGDESIEGGMELLRELIKRETEGC
jgi:hypothetical protein